MLTRKQRDLLIYIHERLRTNGVSPSFDEMKEALGLKSKSGVHRLVNALVEREFLKRLPNRARALEVVRLPDAATPKTARPSLVHDSEAMVAASPNVIRADFGPRRARGGDGGSSEIPLHGKIAAGVPVEALEVHQTLAVPAQLLGRGEHFALEISGDSMVEAGILDGDYAIVQRCDVANDGDIVVALVDDNDATLKTLRRTGRDVRLEPANARYQPQVYEASRIRVQGRLVGLIRRY